MAEEIERKFLVSGAGWRSRVERSVAVRQAYLTRGDALTMRVRIFDDKDAFLTIKSAQPGMTRSEFEYVIPLADARDLIQLHTGLVIEKCRHIVRLGKDLWEVDVFEGAHAGLVIAEIELSSEDSSFERPDWLGAEVTHDPRYYNANLATQSQAEAIPEKA